MKIINLMEDTIGHANCTHEHGLSFYIETKNHRILMDTGASENMLSNAKELGVDLAKVDNLFLSHGHYDHTGGVIPFAKRNPNCPIWMQKSAGEDFFNMKNQKEKYIGIDKEILTLPGLKILEGDCRIDEELFLFSGIRGRKYFANGNRTLKKYINGTYVEDDFSHEQCLVITQGKKHILLSGCAHNGILNILDRYQEIFDGYPDIVISGFHMMQEEYLKQDRNTIREIAENLSVLPTVFYTGHCTGLEAYHMMKQIMKDKLHYVHCGEMFTFTE